MTKDILPLKSMTVKELSGVAHLKDADLTREMKELAKHNTELCAVAGEINGHATKPTALGASTFFTGSFIGINRRTGATYRSGKFYPPKDFADTLLGVFAGSSGQAIRFNVVISVAESTKGALGYTYISEPIKTAEVINRDAELMATLGQMPKLLEKKKA